ncbi:hypothetical protein OHV05_09720 [Kitasatospora sp. NBC_00070]|uniref:hypothetical protein n=1 Tax=Kitasatospora sp. NBC_00070 TaxID=2975962 RepID=UPI003252BA77
MASRRAVLALASALLAGGLVMSGTTVAQADTGTGITVREAHNDWSNNGKLVLGLTAQSAVKDIKVSLYSMAATETSATVTRFELTSGTAEDGTWTNVGRVQLPALGSYRIDVSATDAGGDTLTATGVGYFYYSVQTNLKDAKVDRTTVDYDHRTVTISGHLMGQWPGSGVITPMGGLTVAVNSRMEYAEVTTGVDGGFTATLPVTDIYQNTIEASFDYDPNHIFYSQSRSREFPITIKQTPTKVVQTPSTRRVPFKGVVDSTSSTLLWKSPIGWQPLAGKRLGSNSFPDYVQLTTDANGTVQFPATTPLWSNYTISSGWSSDDIFLAGASAGSEITVVQPAAFQAFAATRTDAATVDVTGEMNFAGTWTPAPIAVDIQYSATGKGGWTTVTTVPSANWNGQGYAFSATVPSAGAGYWRASFTNSPQWEKAVSKVVQVPAL